MKKFLFLTLLASFALQAPKLYAQINQTPRIRTDSLTSRVPQKKDQDISYLAKHNAMKSALIPGWGQFQNKQYWKIPIIYAGIAAVAYLFVDNYSNYQDFTRAYVYRVDQDPLTEVSELKNYSNSQLLARRADYRQNLDYIVLVGVVGYAIQILDAAVFTHLSFFDVSPSVALNTSWDSPNQRFNYQPSIKFQIKL